MSVIYSTILVNLEAGRSNAHLLAAAGQVADRFQAGVIGSTACSPIQLANGSSTGDGYAWGDIIDQDSKEIERETKVAEAEFRDAFGNRALFLDWRSAVLVTSLSDHLAREASRADLILTQAVSPDSFNAARQVDTGELVMRAGRPVLVVASATVPFRMERVVIGWKDTREARRAVADALPMLQKASHVEIVEIASEDELSAARERLDDVAGWLGRHGIAAETHAKQVDGDAAAWFDIVAAERDADIVVAGAYGHSRMREWALGGVTRTLLKHTARSSLVSH
jgi:nucleotide-binding universal stress UspA family protein